MKTKTWQSLAPVLWLAFVFGLVGFATTAKAEVLSLDQFLDQVKSQNQGVQGSTLLSEGAGERSGESQLLYAPQAFVNTVYLYDQRPVLQPGFQPSSTKAAQLSLGVMKQTDFGLNAKLYHTFTSTNLSGTNPQFLPNPNYMDTAPVIELSQSFWRNGFGAETRAQSQFLESSALATRHAESFRVKAALASAEGAYWRLSLARETLQIQEDSLNRSKKIRDWAANRAQLNLADKADLLQAEASYKLREYELKMVEEELQSASRAFNLARGVDSIEVLQKIEPFDSEKLAKVKIPERAKSRDDVKAADEQQKALSANAEIGRQKNSPSLDLAVTASLNGRDPAFGNSLSEAYTTQHPYASVGLKFSTPLDFSLLKQNRAGYEKERLGAELNYTRKVQEQESEWKDLIHRFRERRDRLTLVQQIESAQKTKVDYERERLKQAKTTTYQVLLFEEDYANSRRTRLRVEAEMLTLVAQMKTFGGADESR